MVAPYVGAWIETSLMVEQLQQGAVAPYVGAWIETSMSAYGLPRLESHPMWVRGLKPCSWRFVGLRNTVAPYVGAWIETSPVKWKIANVSRTLCGCVD